MCFTDTSQSLIIQSHEHITPILNSLHWLPVVNHIKFKILLLVFKIKHGFAPTYLSDLLQPMIPSRSLRSSIKNMLISNILLVPALILAMVIVPSLLPPQNFGTVCQLVSVRPLQLNVSNPISSVSCLIRLID